MSQGRLSDGTGQIDHSLPVALDRQLNRISVSHALHSLTHESIFYCPKCYELNPNHKTIVVPIKHSPPYFRKLQGEYHLNRCPYKKGSEAKYFDHLSQKVKIDLDGEKLNLSLMPYEGRGIVNSNFHNRLKLHLREDHLKFMRLVRHLLTDYDIKTIEKHYKRYKVSCDRYNKPLPFGHLIQSVENIKSNKRPYCEKLNLLVGTITTVYQTQNKLWLEFDSTNSPFSILLYLHQHLYDPSILTYLHGKKIAVLGYVIKDNDQYLIEVLSVPHQIAILGENPSDLPITDLTPQLQLEQIRSQLHAPFASYNTLDVSSFVRSFFDNYWSQLRPQQKELNQIEERKKQISNEINACNKELEKANQKIKRSKDRLKSLERKNKGVGKKIKNLLFMRWPQLIREKKQNQLIHKGSELIVQQEEQRLSTLRKENSQLYDRGSEIKQELDQIKEKKRKEQSLKSRIQGYLYELHLGSDYCIVFHLLPTSKDLVLEVELDIYLTQIKHGFYVPCEIEDPNIVGSFNFKTDTYPTENIEQIIADIETFSENCIQRLTDQVNKLAVQ